MEKSLLRSIIQPLLIAAGLALLIRTTLFQIYSIPSESMEPTLQVGDHIVVAPYREFFWPGAPQRGDVIVFRQPAHVDAFLVKRVIGMPGDLVESEAGRVRVDGHTLAEPYLASHQVTDRLPAQLVPENAYFVLGDHRTDSLDSRDWGFVPRELVVGRAQMVVWSAAGMQATPFAHAATPRPPTSMLPRAVRWDRIFTEVR
jgi:signal peptidase I